MAHLFTLDQEPDGCQATSQASRWLTARRLGDGLVQAEDIAFRIVEPCGLFRPQHADVIDGLEAGEVVVVERHALLLKRLDRVRDVCDLPTHRGVFRLRPLRFGE